MAEKNEINFKTLSDNYDPKKNKTMNIITLYEKTCIIGLRMQQIAKGSPSTLDKKQLEHMTSLEEIVDQEFKQQKLPFIICRKLPDGEKEYWKVKDLIDIV